MSVDSKLAKHEEFCKKVQYLVNKVTCEHENLEIIVTNPAHLACGQVSYALSIELDDAKPMEAMVTARWFDLSRLDWRVTEISAWDIDIWEWEVEKMKKEKVVKSAYPGLPESLENDLAAINRTVKSALNAKSENVFGLYPKHIYYYDNDYTTVLWNDGTKTTVKLSDDDIYDEYSAFCAALAKRIYGSNSRIKKIIKTQGRFLLSKEEKKARKKERKERAEMKSASTALKNLNDALRSFFKDEEE